AKHCKFCKKQGHVISECFSLKQQQSQNISSPNQNASFSFASLPVPESEANSDKWFADSGASSHSSCHREWFHEFKEGYTGEQIHTAKGLVKVMGYGKIKGQFWNG